MTIDGSVCRIHTPPSSCSSIAYFVGSVTMMTSAPTFTSSETIFAVRASSACDASGRR